MQVYGHEVICGEKGGGQHQVGPCPPESMDAPWTCAPRGMNMFQTGTKKQEELCTRRCV